MSPWYAHFADSEVDRTACASHIRELAGARFVDRPFTIGGKHYLHGIEHLRSPPDKLVEPARPPRRFLGSPFSLRPARSFPTYGRGNCSPVFLRRAERHGRDAYWSGPDSHNPLRPLVGELLFRTVWNPCSASV